MAEFVLPDVPVTQLLVRTRESIQIYDGPINSNGAISLRKAELFGDVTDLRICPLYSPDGSVVVYTFEKKVMSIHNTATGAQLFALPIGDAEYVEFSPRGTFLVTWSRPTKGSATAPPSADNGNFRVWSASTGALVTAFSLKVYKAQSIQWTANEEYCFRLVTNEIQIFRGDSLTVPIDKVYHKGLTQFQITSTVTPYVSVAAFNPESGGKPARVTLFRFNPKPSTETVSTTEEGEKTDKVTSVEGPVSSRTIFAASEAKLMWNAPGTALLVYAQADTDATSYYGATGLFLLQAHTDAAIKVEQSKDGPVHDVQWSPVGDRFVVSAGTMPCHTTLHDAAGVPVYQYGAAHRNTISWSPHGRFLCVAGFGNLAGEMDFYDTLRSKKIGSTASHCATYHAWSPDSRHFVTASLAPRMNVDNNLKVFKYNGAGPVVQVPFDRAYDVRWRPSVLSVYPNRGPSPKRGGGEADVVAAVAVKPTVPVVQAYRPPGSTGALSRLLNKETAPVGKIVPAKTATATPAAAAPAAKFAPSVQRNRVIPGMAPPGAAPAGAAGNNNNKKAPVSSSAATTAAKSAPKAAPAPAKVAPPAPAAAPVAATAVPVVVDDSKEGREKRAKNISKKLKAIQEIRTKQAAGQPLEPEQKLKLDSEAELLAELKSLTV